MHYNSDITQCTLWFHYTTTSLSLQATHASCTVGTSPSPPLPQRWATMGRKGTGGTHLTSETKDLSLIMKVIQKGLGHITYSIDSVVTRKHTRLSFYPSIHLHADPFDAPNPIYHRLRTQSAPARVQLIRQKSASIYRAPPGGRRVMSAMPRPPSGMGTRELATGPIT